MKIWDMIRKHRNEKSLEKGLEKLDAIKRALERDGIETLDQNWIDGKVCAIATCDEETDGRLTIGIDNDNIVRVWGGDCWTRAYITTMYL